MDYFNRFSSNTLAGSGNQSFFYLQNPDTVSTARLFFKIFKAGCFHYSLLFSNIIDSTYSTGDFSHKNLLCDQWYIDRLRVSICNSCNCETMVILSDFIDLTFQGETKKTVMPGEFYYTDPVLLDIHPQQYLCLEISFHGTMIPCHPESIIPTFLYQNGCWIPSKNMPVPSMIGCDRPVKQRISYLGDSITQGIGTAPNSYTHWNSILSQELGADNAYWNLGLGFGRADDAASDGAWLFKAKQSDIVFVCFGVNDILQNFDEIAIRNNIVKIVEYLSNAGIKVFLQTIPPFDYNEKHKIVWEHLNQFIKNDLSKKYFVFDNIPVLSDSQKGSHCAKYGGHPDAEGCALWASHLFKAIKNYI